MFRLAGFILLAIFLVARLDCSNVCIQKACRLPVILPSQPCPYTVAQYLVYGAVLFSQPDFLVNCLEFWRTSLDLSLLMSLYSVFRLMPITATESTPATVAKRVHMNMFDVTHANDSTTTWRRQPLLIACIISTHAGACDLIISSNELAVCEASINCCKVTKSSIQMQEAKPKATVAGAMSKWPTVVWIESLVRDQKRE